MKLSSSQVLIVFFEKSQKKIQNSVKIPFSRARVRTRIYYIYYYIYILYFIIIYYYIFYLFWVYCLLFKHYARTRARNIYKNTKSRLINCIKTFTTSSIDKSNVFYYKFYQNKSVTCQNIAYVQSVCQLLLRL